MKSTLTEEERKARKAAVRAAYRASHRAQIRAYRAEWRNKRAEEINEKQRNYYHATKVLKTEKTVVLSTERTCVECGKTHPATSEFFYNSRFHAGGLDNRCKPCRRMKKKMSYNGSAANRRVVFLEDRVTDAGPIVRERTPSGGTLVSFNVGWKPFRDGGKSNNSWAGYSSSLANTTEAPL